MEMIRRNSQVVFAIDSIDELRTQVALPYRVPLCACLSPLAVLDSRLSRSSCSIHFCHSCSVLRHRLQIANELPILPVGIDDICAHPENTKEQLQEKLLTYKVCGCMPWLALLLRCCVLQTSARPLVPADRHELLRIVRWSSLVHAHAWCKVGFFAFQVINDNSEPAKRAYRWCVNHTAGRHVFWRASGAASAQVHGSRYLQHGPRQVSLAANAACTVSH